MLNVAEGLETGSLDSRHSSYNFRPFRFLGCSENGTGSRRDTSTSAGVIKRGKWRLKLLGQRRL